MSPMDTGLEETLQNGKLLRQFNGLIVAHLCDNNLNQAAAAVASATMTLLNVEAPPNKLVELVAKGLEVERDEASKGISPATLFDTGTLVSSGYASALPRHVVSVDFSTVKDTKATSKSFLKHETRQVFEHQKIARCARFSPDGRFLATGMLLVGQYSGDRRQWSNQSDKICPYGGMYVTVSKDGAIRVWDGVTAQCLRSVIGAHGSAEATSACFTRDKKFVLSCGKDSTLSRQATFNETEEFILYVDEPSNEIVVWDALTAEVVARWPSNHIGAPPRWLEHSPTDAAFITCEADRSVHSFMLKNNYSDEIATIISEKGCLLFSQLPSERVGEKIEIDRMYDSVNLFLSLQSENGGLSAWEPATAHKWLEVLNPTEFFQDIVIEHEYVEWLAATGKNCNNNLTVRKASEFLLSTQLASGGRGESY
ncbi:hypothetical protein GIB67_019330, partial [Kingdonia uniflora]